MTGEATGRLTQKTITYILAPNGSEVGDNSQLHIPGV